MGEAYGEVSGISKRFGGLMTFRAIAPQGKLWAIGFGERNIAGACHLLWRLSTMLEDMHRICDESRTWSCDIMNKKSKMKVGKETKTLIDP